MGWVGGMGWVGWGGVGTVGWVRWVGWVGWAEQTVPSEQNDAEALNQASSLCSMISRRSPPTHRPRSSGLLACAVVR